MQACSFGTVYYLEWHICREFVVSMLTCVVDLVIQSVGVREIGMGALGIFMISKPTFQ